MYCNVVLQCFCTYTTLISSLWWWWRWWMPRPLTGEEIVLVFVEGTVSSVLIVATGRCCHSCVSVPYLLPPLMNIQFDTSSASEVIRHTCAIQIRLLLLLLLWQRGHRLPATAHVRLSLAASIGHSFTFTALSRVHCSATVELSCLISVSGSITYMWMCAWKW